MESLIRFRDKIGKAPLLFICYSFHMPSNDRDIWTVRRIKKTGKYEFKYDVGCKYVCRICGDRTYKSFLRDMHMLTEGWQTHYHLTNCCDGHHLTVVFPEIKLATYMSNNYPDNYKEFEKCLNKYFDSISGFGCDYD